MSSIATHVIKGPAAWLIVQQAKRLAEINGKKIFQILGSHLHFQIGVFDESKQTLVVFDDVALIAMAMLEGIEDGHVEGNHLINVTV